MFTVGEFYEVNYTHLLGVLVRMYEGKCSVKTRHSVEDSYYLLFFLYITTASTVKDPRVSYTESETHIGGNQKRTPS